MFHNFLSFFGNVARTKHSTRAAYGNFTSKQEVNVTFTAEGIKRSRRFISSERYTALGEIGVSIGELLDDVRGYDASMIEEDGSVTTELFLAKMRAYGGIGRNTRTAMEMSPSSFMWEDSQVSLLVSMLSRYYVAAYKEMKVNFDAGVYDDGHLTAKLQDYFTSAPLTDDWRAEDLVDWNIYSASSQEAPPDAPVLHVGAMRAELVSVILAALSGTRKTTRLAFDLEMPPLAQRVYLTTDVEGVQRPQVDVPSRVVREALDTYVKINRLSGPFETALAIYHQCAMVPVPDTAEGLVWLKRRRTVVLPKFDAFRGAYTAVLQGKSFGSSAQVVSTMKWWQDVGLATAAIAARYNAVSLWGRYFVEGEFYHTDAEVNHLGYLQFDENPSAAYYSYAALVTGGEVYAAVPAQYGLKLHPWDREVGMIVPVSVRDVQLAGYDIVVDEGGAGLRVKHLPPPCSAVHVLGRMPHGGIFDPLSSRFSITIERDGEGWIAPNVSSAWGLGMLFRWAGYDLTMTYRGKTKRANWASNASSIAVRPFHVSGRDARTVEIDSWQPRKHIFMVMPSFAGDTTVFEVQVAVNPDVAYVADTGPAIVVQGSYKPPTMRGDSVVLPEPIATLAFPVAITASQPSSLTMAGFQVTRPSTEAHPPDPRPSLAVTDQDADDPSGEGEVTVGEA